MDQIVGEALKLPVSSRAELAEELVDSLDLLNDAPDSHVKLDEMLRRRDEVHAGKVQTTPGEEVLAEVRRMLAQ